MNVPAEIEGYHKALTMQIELYLEMAEIMIKVFENMNTDLSKSGLNIEEQMRLIQELNTKSQAFNHYNRLGHQELIRAFEQGGIKYEIVGDKIKYYRD
ncbi:MAG: hypothetical protein FWJ59_07335 [Caldicoprobacter sp.]